MSSGASVQRDLTSSRTEAGISIGEAWLISVGKVFHRIELLALSAQSEKNRHMALLVG